MMVGKMRVGILKNKKNVPKNLHKNQFNFLSQNPLLNFNWTGGILKYIWTGYVNFDRVFIRSNAKKFFPGVPGDSIM